MDRPLFKNQSTFIISGCSRSGKTFFVETLLENLEGVFEKGRPVNILYCFSKIQPTLIELEKKISNLELHHGLPTMATIKEKTSPDSELLLILDDLTHDVIASKEIADLFCTGRHLNMSIIFLTQNLLEQGKYSRAINLNTCYIILFKNLRDANQINYLARQIFPQQSRDFMNIYHDVMKERYQYLVVDLHPQSEDATRLRTNVFPSEEMSVYTLDDA